MKPVLFASLALVCLMPSAVAEDACQSLQGLIVDGQADTPFSGLAEKPEGQLRNKYLNFKDAPLLGIFRQCRLQDTTDKANRPISMLTCEMEENHGMSLVTPESRAAFMANELEIFKGLPACVQALEGWSGYGDMTSFSGYSVFNKVDASGDPWDQMNGMFKFSTRGAPPLYVGQLTMELRTVPRDPK